MQTHSKAAALMLAGMYVDAIDNWQTQVSAASEYRQNNPPQKVGPSKAERKRRRMVKESRRRNRR